MTLPKHFYLNEDVNQVALSLVGKRLCTQIDGIFTAGIITETEAYSGKNDRACHAYLNKNTKRTRVMFGPGGHAYVYLCYGIHHLFNIVTNTQGNADAVLVRAISPEKGIENMLERRGMKTPKPNLTAGPGSMSKAMGITTDLYGENLTGQKIWLEETGLAPEIENSPRIGVGYAGEDALLPWRYFDKNSPFVSGKKPKSSP